MDPVKDNKKLDISTSGVGQRPQADAGSLVISTTRNTSMSTSAFLLPNLAVFQFASEVVTLLKIERRTPEQTDPDRLALLEKGRLMSVSRVHRECDTEEWRKGRGQQHDILDRRKHFLLDRIKSVYALPTRDNIASNYGKGTYLESLYFVNGMRCAPSDVKHHIDSLLHTYGRPLTAIINGQESSLTTRREPGVIKPVLNACKGLLSAKQGHAAETSAVLGMEQAIKDHIKNRIPMHIVAHSQGSIIVCNALTRLLSKDSSLSSEQKAQMKSLVRVSTFGAAEHYFPKGVSVQEFAHRFDPVTVITELVAGAREGVLKIANLVGKISNYLRGLKKNRLEDSSFESCDEKIQLKKAPKAYLDGSHSFGPYIQKLPEFFIKKFGGNSPDAGLLTARALVESISHGQLSDKMHSAIIEAMINRKDQAFARELLSKAKNGFILFFKIPYIEELKRLASDKV